MQLGLNLGFSPARRHSGYGSSRFSINQFWTFSENTAGKTLSVDYLNFTGDLVIDWGDGTIAQYEPEAEFQKVLGNTQRITIYSTGSLLAFVSNFSQAQVGGNVDVSAFPDLIELTINFSSLSSITGYENNSNLKFLSFNSNIGSTITLPPSFESMVNLESFQCVFSNISGTLPILNLPNLLVFNCSQNQFTGSIPNLSGSPNLGYFQCNQNQLTGSIPNLDSNTILEWFIAYQNNLNGTVSNFPPSTTIVSIHTNQLTGSMPDLSQNASLDIFHCFENQMTGSISQLPANPNLTDFRCSRNIFTGSIPNLSSCTALQIFECDSQYGATKITGFAGGAVSNTLGSFLAHNNQLTSSAVNAILAAFRAAGRTSASGSCVLNLGGTGNAAPTGQGLTDKGVLLSRGWTVVTN
jgi:hypothetical protein